jgi:hypothetical protein
MAERLATGNYDQLHHFIADGVWDATPLESELLKQADRLVGGKDAATVLSLNQPCPPGVTPSSISSFGRRLSGARTADNESLKNRGTNRFCQSSGRAYSQNRFACPQLRALIHRHRPTIVGKAVVSNYAARVPLRPEAIFRAAAWDQHNCAARDRLRHNLN